MNITPIARWLMARRVKAAQSWSRNTPEVQTAQLKTMIRSARNTEWGRNHGYKDIAGYRDYVSHVDITPYDELRPLVMRMIRGEKDVLWPGVIARYAQSSGTSDGKSKYIPISNEGLQHTHYRGASDVVAHYLHLHPESKLFSGKGFILGGSYANELQGLGQNVRVGDLSAHLIDNIAPVAELVRTPSKATALLSNWEVKLPRLVSESVKRNVTNLSGVPSWFLTVLRMVLNTTGAKELHEVWPNLEVFFHGGISFTPYREQYDAIINRERMNYMETYNASEGFFALQDSVDSHSLLLLMDAGVFYEFVPVDSPESPAVPAWELEQGKTYAMIITTCSGLWRYPLGDTVTVQSTNPVRITIAGRTKSFINAFGEEVMVHNTDTALAAACAITGAHVREYTAAPVFTAEKTKGRHEWLIEFDRKPANLDEFASILDSELQKVNSDYQAKRSGGIFLDRLSVVDAKAGVFDRWLAMTGKLGGQRKVPRLCNDRRIMDQLLKINESI